ncbi:alanine racemase [Candidatus Heimdallarchaeota archaeon B3_Heim]|nr:MAG: alanine racemase [Candidatus Heimdallarchaeota archaeon B3_Heim]
MKITKPALLIDENKVRQNIKKFVAKTAKSKIHLRPHFKTHQSKTIGNWFKEYGVSRITVSSVDMAKYFVNAGWQDITVAFPLNIRQMDAINQLAHKCKLGVLVESVDSTSILTEKVTTPLSVWIEIDQGYHRTGVQNDNILLAIAEILEKESLLNFTGLLTHAGHAYSAQSVDELKKIHQSSMLDLKQKQGELKKQGFSECQLSLGDTPTCSVSDEYTGIDEIRPGSFVFYDLEQLSLGACTESELAMGVACPVVAKYPKRNQIIIYGGAVHLSKEFQITPTGEKSFGKVALLSDEGWSSALQGTYVSSISQEHGIIHTDTSTLEKVQIGDILFIFPVHACLTANLFSQYRTLTGVQFQKMQSFCRDG